MQVNIVQLDQRTEGLRFEIESTGWPSKDISTVLTCFPVAGRQVIPSVA